jgi:hypothetical protein
MGLRPTPVHENGVESLPAGRVIHPTANRESGGSCHGFTTARPSALWALPGFGHCLARKGPGNQSMGQDA